MKKYVSSIAVSILCIVWAAALPGCGSVPSESARQTPAATIAAVTEVPSYSKSIKIQKVTFASKRLNQDMRMNVYLPMDYDPEQDYAVLYLIHGFDCNEKSWEKMNLVIIAGQLFQSGEVKPFIVVTPHIGNSFAINSSETAQKSGELDLGPYEDYMIQDVIGYVDAHYSTITSREGRYIGGFSMGGYVALHLGMAYTDLFSKIGGHSPAALLSADTRPDISHFIYAQEADEKQRSPMKLAENADLSNMSIFLDCGTEDRLSKGTELLYNKLAEKGVQVEYHAFSGGHTMGYWGNHMKEYLLFYGANQ